MRRVIKIGGSLLLRESFARSLDRWVRRQSPSDCYAIVGGGELIDAIRRLDQRFRREPNEVHWECVQLLRVTFDWLGEQLEGWNLCQRVEEFQTLRQTQGVETDRVSKSVRPNLIAVDTFYQPDGTSQLPEDWSTTTDAIAGWLSTLLNADELILLKSCDADPDASLRQWSQTGLVDTALPDLEDQLPPIRWVNFARELERAGSSRPSDFLNPPGVSR